MTNDLHRAGDAATGVERAAPRRATTAPVSVMIFTLDEEIHLPSCLAALAGWCDDVIVVDSFSTDGTERIAREWGARFFQHEFLGFGASRNWAMSATSPRHDWVLILDADERVPPELAAEIARVLATPPAGVGAFRMRRRFHMWGRWLRHSSLYPTWVVRLVHRERVRYANRGHAETQEVDGEIRELQHDLIDENLKGVEEWFARQNRYSSREAAFELVREATPFSWSDVVAGDPLRRRAAWKRVAGAVPGRPVLFFLYSYVWRRGFMDGKDGLVFCFMKMLYESMIVIKKYDARRREPSVRER